MNPRQNKNIKIIQAKYTGEIEFLIITKLLKGAYHRWRSTGYEVLVFV